MFGGSLSYLKSSYLWVCSLIRHDTGLWSWSNACKMNVPCITGVQSILLRTDEHQSSYSTAILNRLLLLVLRSAKLGGRLKNGLNRLQALSKPFIACTRASPCPDHILSICGHFLWTCCAVMYVDGKSNRKTRRAVRRSPTSFGTLCWFSSLVQPQHWNLCLRDTTDLSTRCGHVSIDKPRDSGSQSVVITSV